MTFNRLLILCLLVWMFGFSAPLRAYSGPGARVDANPGEEGAPPPPPPPGEKPEELSVRTTKFGLGISFGLTTALASTEGSFLLSDGGGAEIGGIIGLYPLLFAEGGVEAMRFDLTTDEDKANQRRVRLEMWGYYFGAGAAIPLSGYSLGFKYRMQRNSLLELQLEDRYTGETQIYRDRATRRSYFLFLALGTRSKRGGRETSFLEFGLRYDDVDPNVFLVSDVFGVYGRFQIHF